MKQSIEYFLHLINWMTRDGYIIIKTRNCLLFSTHRAEVHFLNYTHKKTNTYLFIMFLWDTFITRNRKQGLLHYITSSLWSFFSRALRAIGTIDCIIYNDIPITKSIQATTSNSQLLLISAPSQSTYTSLNRWRYWVIVGTWRKRIRGRSAIGMGGRYPLWRGQNFWPKIRVIEYSTLQRH